jgi:nicotinate-nucleotide pyrophosphorylase (carboxylating)
MTSQSQIEKIIDLALDEDTGRGDITSEALIPSNMAGKAIIVANEAGLLVGGEIARMIFLKTDGSLEIEIQVEDGKEVKPGDIVATVKGRVTSILKAERVALNLIGLLSGIATETARYVAEMKGSATAISDTRKTTPGLRMLEKYAVYAAGGQTHRPDLGSGIIIKDNHLVALAAKGKAIKDAVEMAREKAKGNMKVEIEVNTVAQAQEAADAKADVIMLDNMSVEDMKKAVDLIPEGIQVEASGGITLENVREVAMTGVDVISVGAITHSARSLDFSLEFPVPKSEATPAPAE